MAVAAAALTVAALTAVAAAMVAVAALLQKLTFVIVFTWLTYWLMAIREHNIPITGMQ